MRSSRVARPGERGISLVEITVVVAVLGMMVSVGFPAMQGWLDRYRARSAAAEIATAVQLQRMRAVSQNQQFSMLFDVEAGTYALYQGDPDTGQMLDVVARSLPFGVAFAGSNNPVDTPDNRIFFHPDGSMNDATAATDTIWVANVRGDAFTVSFNRSTGRVQVQHESYGS